MVLLASLAMLAACGSAEPSNLQGNGAAAPPPGEPDNRIECRPAGVASFARVCTLDSAPTARGNMLTIRKADGGFRRLIETNDGHFLAADGAQQAHAIPLQDRRTEVEIGGDRFRIPPNWRHEIGEPVEPFKAPRP